MQNIEGYVIRLASGQRVKIKTAWYLALHHTKDSINSPRRLFEAVLEEATDDMRSLFYDDKLANSIRIQYGGSAKPGNAKDLLAMEDIDGLLVGGASLNADDFLAIIQAGV